MDDLLVKSVARMAIAISDISEFVNDKVFNDKTKIYMIKDKLYRLERSLKDVKKKTQLHNKRSKPKKVEKAKKKNMDRKKEVI